MAPRARLGAFGALWFFYFAGIGTFSPFAPLWFKEMGLSTLAIGGIASLQSWTRVIAPMAWGWLGDRGGQRVRLVQAASVAALLASCALLLVQGHAALALCTLLLFLANGGVVPLTEATLAQHLKTADGVDSARYGRVRVWGSVGFVCAVLAFGVVLESAGIGLFPWLVVAVNLALLAAALRLPRGHDDAAGHASAPPLASVLRRPEVAWFFASVFFTVLAHTSLYTFFSLFLDAHGHGKSVVGLMWAVAVLAEVAFFWWQGRFFDRISPYRWLQWAALLTALRFASVAAFGDQVWALGAVQALHAITFAAQHFACIALLARHFPGALRGRGQALYSMLGYGVSGIVGGLAGGWISTRFGLDAVFQAAAAVALLGWACAWKAARAAHDAPARP